MDTESLGGGNWRFTLHSLAALEGADASKILRQERDGTGSWQTRSAFEPATEAARLGIAAHLPGRKVFPGAWQLGEIASTLASAAGDLALVSAEHTSQGDLAARTWGGNGSATLEPGETLTLVYEPSELETEASQSWFALLEKDESWTAPTAGLALGQPPDMPKSFALYQNQPNPFHHTTSIRFDLPKPTSVRLTIYDIAGRKVRTLANSNWPAGRHSLEWDHRSDAGVQLGAGAYIYRLSTDEYRSEKKMILLSR